MFTAAIVGCGAIANVHAAALKAMDNVTVIGCADIKPEKAKAMSEKLDCPAYSSLEEMLDAKKPDVLHICTPHHLHVPMALEAISRGIAVLSEKPEGITHEQLDALAKAEEQGARVGICFQNRYNEAVEEARLLLESGKSGKIKGVRAFVTWNRQAPYYTNSGWRGSKETEGGGVMINQAIHTLDLIQYLCGYPLSVQGHVDNYHLQGVIDVEDTATLYLTLPGNVPALMFATTAYSVDSPVVLEIVCEEMVLRLEGNTLKLLDKGGQIEITSAPVEYKKTNTIGKCYWGDGHPSLFRDFYHCMEEGKPFPIGAAEGAKAMRVLLGLYQSSQTGKAVQL